MRIIKIIEFDESIKKNNENLEFPRENHENHINLITPLENHENHEKIKRFH